MVRETQIPQMSSNKLFALRHMPFFYLRLHALIDKKTDTFYCPFHLRLYAFMNFVENFERDAKEPTHFKLLMEEW